MIKTYDVKCDLCQSDDAEVLVRGGDRLYGGDDVFTYVKCKNCGLVYMNPCVCPEETAKLYPENYAPHQRKNAGGDKCKNSLGARLKRTSVLAGLQNMRKTFLDSTRIASRVLKNLNAESRVRDVGCGGGEFLNRIKSRTGCEVCGVDISPEAAIAAGESYGMDIFTGTITEASFAEGWFDVITSWWCLEHVPNPSETVRKMASLLKDDGWCVIGVPNIDSFNARVFGDKWYHLDCPRHLHIYSPATVGRLLDKAGLEVVRTVYGKTPWGLSRSLRYYFGDDAVPLKQRKRPRGFSMLKRILLPFTIILALLKQSDIMVVYARKKQVG